MLDLEIKKKDIKISLKMFRFLQSALANKEMVRE